MAVIPPEEGPPPEFEAEIALLTERTAELDEVLRRLGLYLEGGQVIPVETPMGPKPALAVVSVIGDVAYTGRVQDPETDAFNDEFRVMEADTETDAFLDERARIQRNIAEGRDPLDDGDES